MQKQKEFPLPLPALRLVEKRDNLIRLVIDDQYFGKLSCVYDPERAVGTLAKTFSKKLSAEETLHGFTYALGLIHEKIDGNLRDALEGMVREIVFQTYRDLNGHAVFGDLKSKEAINAIKQWHAQASGKRMGATRGPQKDTTDFIRKVTRAAREVKGRMTQEKLAVELRIGVRGLQNQISEHGYTWRAIKDLCQLELKRRT